ncbi:MFS transporter [Kribbella sp. NPDC026596]|uniref:MFS transporter n=1 Tax=Kribbella sp. NPDC026596 TaxID=3155122 RepID=UPI0034087774
MGGRAPDQGQPVPPIADRARGAVQRLRSDPRRQPRRSRRQGTRPLRRRYGIALSAGGAGAFVGAMLGLRLAKRLGYGRAFAASLILSTGLPLLLAFIPGRGLQYGVLLGAIQFLAGIGLGSANVLSVTIRQLLIPRTALARSNGAYRTFTFGVLPIGAALGGVLGSTFGTTAAVAVGTAGIALSALPMLVREVRTLETPVTTAA